MGLARGGGPAQGLPMGGSGHVILPGPWPCFQSRGTVGPVRFVLIAGKPDVPSDFPADGGGTPVEFPSDHPDRAVLSHQGLEDLAFVLT